MDRATAEANFEAAKNSDPSSVLSDQSWRKAYRKDGKIIKFGSGAAAAHAEFKNLAYLRQLELEVQIGPISSFHTGANDFFYMESEEIEGITLYDAWADLTHNEKENYARQVRKILDRLRSFKGSYIGGLDNSQAIDMRIDRQTGGPFENEAAFNDFLMSNIMSRAPNVFKEMVRSGLTDNHDIVLTHSDLNARNIIINAGKIVGLIDWEFSGFYPEYWEYVQFFRSLDNSIDWHEYANIIFPESYPQQYINDSFLGRLSKH